jgi:type IV secretion system protein VirB2
MLRHTAALEGPLEVPMIAPLLPIFPRRIARRQVLRWIRPAVNLLTFLAVFPALAHAQSGSPFDTGFTAMQTLFTGTVAKVASLIAIVVGGYQFAHGEPGAKKALGGIAAGTGIAVLATNVLSWLWGI